MVPMDPHTSLPAEMLHHRVADLPAGVPIALPLTPASTFALPGTTDAPFTYGRAGTPTWSALEQALGLLEQAETVVVPSGMAAISAVLLTHLTSGDRVLLPCDGYYATRSLAERFLVPAGIEVVLRPTAEYAEQDLTGVALVLLETPSNPGLDLCDIAEVSARAHSAGALVVVDNTTLTPFGQRPLDLGADVVVASDTKAPNGHSDALLGHVASRRPAVLERVREWRTLAGGIPGQLETWLVHRGLETLELRVDRMCTSAQVLAERLTEHPAVQSVVHPGLADHPQRELAARQMARAGSLIGITLADEDAAERFLAAARLVVPATSFGGVHTSGERRARWGDAVPGGFVRLSVGCEPTEALWQDLDAALRAQS